MNGEFNGQPTDPCTSVIHTPKVTRDLKVIWGSRAIKGQRVIRARKETPVSPGAKGDTGEQTGTWATVRYARLRNVTVVVLEP
jgi:hypothetical protein